MLSSVLTSERAIEVNIVIMRTFVKLRQLLATHEDLAHRLDQLEWRQAEQDGRVHYVFETIQHLIEAPPEEPKRKLDFPRPKPVRLLLSDYGGERSRCLPETARSVAGPFAATLSPVPSVWKRRALQFGLVSPVL